MLAPGSMMWSEVFAAETPLQQQLCARLPGALTGGTGVHRAGVPLDQARSFLSCPFLSLKHKSVLKLACAVARGLHVLVGHAGGRRPSQELLLLKQVLNYKGK